MVIHIPLSNTHPVKHGNIYEAIVSDEDKDLAELNWSVTISRKTSYANRRQKFGNKRLNIKLHRVILERILGRKLEKGELADHIDRNGLNNTRENLRVCSTAENTKNRDINANNTTGALGVFRSKKSKKFGAQIGVNGKRIYLGSFDTVEQAKKARLEAEILYHGDFAALGK